MRILILMLFVCIGSLQGAEKPSTFDGLIEALQWFSIETAESPRVFVVDSGVHHVVVMWVSPDEKTKETEVLTLIKRREEVSYAYVLHEYLEAWEMGGALEEDEHFGHLEYDKAADMLTYFTHVNHKLLLQSLPIREAYGRAKKKTSK